MSNCICLACYVDGVSKMLAACIAQATRAPSPCNCSEQEKSSASTLSKSVSKPATETKQSVSQKEATKPESPCLFSREATASTLRSSEWKIASCRRVTWNLQNYVLTTIQPTCIPRRLARVTSPSSPSSIHISGIFASRNSGVFSSNGLTTYIV